MPKRSWPRFPSWMSPEARWCKKTNPHAMIVKNPSVASVSPPTRLNGANTIGTPKPCAKTGPCGPGQARADCTPGFSVRCARALAASRYPGVSPVMFQPWDLRTYQAMTCNMTRTTMAPRISPRRDSSTDLRWLERVEVPPLGASVLASTGPAVSERSEPAISAACDHDIRRRRAHVARQAWMVLRVRGWSLRLVEQSLA